MKPMNQARATPADASRFSNIGVNIFDFSRAPIVPILPGVADEGDAHGMQVEIRSRGFALTEALREHAERRLSFALSRVNEHVRRVAVRLADVNGPRGGVDKLCRILVTLSRRESVLVEDTASDVYAAIDRAAARAGRSVLRRLGRRGAPPALQENDR